MTQMNFSTYGSTQKFLPSNSHSKKSENLLKIEVEYIEAFRWERNSLNFEDVVNYCYASFTSLTQA